jgi:hypothetical protein
VNFLTKLNFLHKTAKRRRRKKKPKKWLMKLCWDERRLKVEKRAVFSVHIRCVPPLPIQKSVIKESLEKLLWNWGTQLWKRLKIARNQSTRHTKIN